jgi:putative mRNA 3-end processing factor
MKDFATSKVEQDIVVTQATRDLLIAIHNAELCYRSNLIPVNEGALHILSDETIELLDSGHMLGSAHVRVTMRDGYRVGYSSDFFWPLERVLEVDELVVDSTYGNPDAVRRYDQLFVEDKFIELVFNRLRHRPLVIIGYMGRLQYGMSLLAGQIQHPILASRRVARVASVYNCYGYSVGPWIEIESPIGQEIVRSASRYVAFIELPEQRYHNWLRKTSRITLSAYMVPKEEPILDYGNGDYRIALTDHADFPGTLEFVRASGAKKVVTHPGTGNAYALAESIRSRLGINAEVAEELPIRGWG